VVPPETTVVFSTLDLFQSESEAAAFRYVSQLEDTLSPSFSVNGLLVRAQ
jgi:hypothetical protein